MIVAVINESRDRLDIAFTISRILTCNHCHRRFPVTDSHFAAFNVSMTQSLVLILTPPLIPEFTHPRNIASRGKPLSRRPRATRFYMKLTSRTRFALTFNARAFSRYSEMRIIPETSRARQRERELILKINSSGKMNFKGGGGEGRRREAEREQFLARPRLHTDSHYAKGHFTGHYRAGPYEA